MRILFYFLVFPLLVPMSFSQQVITTVPWGNGEGEVGYEIFTDPNGNIESNGPAGFTVDAKGNIYIADSVNKRVLKFNAQGIFLSEIDLPFYGIHDIMVDDMGYIWITHYYPTEDQMSANMDIYKYDQLGNCVFMFTTSADRIWIVGNHLYIDGGEEFVEGKDSEDYQYFLKFYVFDLDGNLVDTIVMKDYHGEFFAFADDGSIYAIKEGYIDEEGYLQEGATIWHYSPDGSIIGKLYLPTPNDSYIADFLGFDREGNLYIWYSKYGGESEGGCDIVRKYSPSGGILGEIECEMDNERETVKLVLAPDGAIYSILDNPNDAPDVPIRVMKYTIP